MIMVRAPESLQASSHYQWARYVSLSTNAWALWALSA
jgi:hypothetical protein